MKTHTIILTLVTHILIGALLPSNNVYANDDVTLYLPWTAKYGQKDLEMCPDGYYAVGISNKDYGNHDQAAYKLLCRRMDTYTGTSSRHINCTNRWVEFTKIRGEKAWSICPDGRYATGFANFDYGKHDQAVNTMRCCALTDTAAPHNSSYELYVSWSRRRGEYPVAQCDDGYFISGIQNKDHGNHDQSVYKIRCSLIR